MKRFRLIAALIIGVTFSMLCFSEAPRWWEDRGLVESVDAENTDEVKSRNQDVATVGQLMYVASKAALELSEKVEGAAGVEIDSMVSNFPRYDSSNPGLNYEVLNIGQLKYVAKKFFDRLWAIEGANSDTVIFPAGMEFISGGTDSTNHKYPWASLPENHSISDYAVNYEAATIGQIKYLFSWSIKESEDIWEDTDNDGIPDLWEYEFFGDLESVDQNSDTDEDGLKDIEELVSWHKSF